MRPRLQARESLVSKSPRSGSDCSKKRSSTLGELEHQALGFCADAMYHNADWYDAFEFSYDMSVSNVAIWRPSGVAAAP